jgi:hypothetical protein
MDNREIEVQLPAVESNILEREAVPSGVNWLGRDAPLTAI